MEICYLAQGGSGRGGEEWGDVGGVLEGKFGGLGRVWRWAEDVVGKVGVVLRGSGVRD
jgi:hypothetical protein